jgi:LmbE family N-acetylglucosaminyl deacetylase
MTRKTLKSRKKIISETRGGMHLFPAAVHLLILLLLAGTQLLAQRDLAGSARIRQNLDRLNTVGSVLMIAAHPDDERTNVLATLARGEHLRTAYLSLTRGEGGQNLIGPEQGALLGIIRTQELLAARRIDGAEQFFTRAIDFGFSKTPAESFEKWGHEEVLSDVVWVIRKFRPDVIILRWIGTPADAHGHHQASSILGKEAFTAAADRSRFPEQLKDVEPWQAARLFLCANKAAPNTIELDTGKYDPVLGYSYSEIAGMSRSMHRSQGQGTAEPRTSAPAYFVAADGKPATTLLTGVDTTWKKLPGGEPLGALLKTASDGFDDLHPDRTIGVLLKARALLKNLHAPEAIGKLADLDETIALCGGLWLDASTSDQTSVPGSAVKITATAIVRSAIAFQLTGVNLPGGAPKQEALKPLQPFTQVFNWNIPAAEPFTQPYWLRKPPVHNLYTVDDRRHIGLPDALPALEARFTLHVGSEDIQLTRQVVNRYVDRVRGELTRPFAIVPPASLQIAEESLIFPDAKSKSISVEVQANQPGAAGSVAIDLPPGWKSESPARTFTLPAKGERSTLDFQIIPPASDSSGEMGAIASIGGRPINWELRKLSYPHFPEQIVLQPASARLVRADIKTLVHHVGYIMGAGDDVPDALAQIGCDVTLLDPNLLGTLDLHQFEAIVTGVRAYNVRPSLVANEHRLLDYVVGGGTLLVQYNTVDGLLTTPAPYPLTISRDRVTVEQAPVRFPDPASPLLHVPNEITESDFNGWVQERGLYFASHWDPHYRTLLESNDPGEKPLQGGTLVTRYGKGVYIFTAYSWFRQLPAGVPGAFRIFANLLSAGKTLP